MVSAGFSEKLRLRSRQTDRSPRSDAQRLRALIGLLLLAGLILSAPAAQAMIDNAMGKAWTKTAGEEPISRMFAMTAFKNKIWGIGVNSNYTRTAIWSSENGVSWQKLSDSSPLDRGDHLVDFQGKLWAIPSSSAYKNTWFSNDGLSWTLVSNHPVPQSFDTILIHNNKLWAFGSTIWSSANGITWTEVSKPELVWNRSGMAKVSFGGKLWLFGGEADTGNYPLTTYNDIWSSDDGVHWTIRARSAAWSPRSGLSAIVFDDHIWLMGGVDAQLKPCHDVWRSADGINWTLVTPAATWEPRQAFSLFAFANRIWLFQGRDEWYAKYFWDLWSATPMPAGTPIIAPIPVQRAQERIAYTGPEPVLSRGSRPIVWSLRKSPAGMTINRNTGIVSWPSPPLAGSPQTITLRASNINGHTDLTWQLAVTPQAPAVLSTPGWTTGSQCTVSWTAQPNVSGYTLQRDDAPDFKTPLQTIKLPATTRQYTFMNQPANRTFWYRVMGQKTGGLTSAWSTVIPCTRDTMSPRGAIKINGGAASTNSYLITLNLSPQDPGDHPSGVSQMRFSWDGLTWGDWEPFAAKKTYKLAPEGLNQRIHAQFQDRMGNLSGPVSAAIQCLATPVCVDDDNTSGPWQGTPAKPYQHIQDAINAAPLGAYIYVAHGTYRESVSLKSGLTVMGGFEAGYFNFATRNLQIDTTVTAPTNGGLVRKTVLIDGVTTVTLDGFKITGGVGGDQVIAANDSVGCGLFCRNINRSCLISHCSMVNNVGGRTWAIFHDNSTVKGGGIYLGNASPTISECLIANNQANEGGGIFCSYSSPLITNCRIQNNIALAYENPVMDIAVPTGGDGGGIYCLHSSPFITNCWIQDNAARLVDYNSNVHILNPTDSRVDGPGDGIFAFESAPTIQNCVISDNSGKGIESSSSPITNCTIDGNGYFGLANCTGPIKNCIIWGNPQGQLSNCSTPAYSDIQGWTGGGTGNLALDPQFAIDGSLHLKLTSPCIDAGGFVPGLTTDLEGKRRGTKIISAPRGDGSGFDIGAFEY